MSKSFDLPAPVSEQRGKYTKQENGDLLLMQNGIQQADLHQGTRTSSNPLKQADCELPLSVPSLAQNGNIKPPIETQHSQVHLLEDELEEEVDDPWKLVEWKDDGLKWKEMTSSQKFVRVIINIGKVCLVVALLYFFVCSLDLLGSAFQLIGGRLAGDAFANDSLLSNPVCGMMIGIVVTAILQSSSTSTSIVVTMVASNIIRVRQAIPIVMGANIGTTITNTLVSLTMSGDRNTFRRAFGAANVHDMFNWLSVITFLPIEAASGYLYHLTSKITENIKQAEGSKPPKFLKVITEPLTKLIVQIDKNVIQDIAKKDPGAKRPLLKYWDKESVIKYNVTFPGDRNETFVKIIDDQSTWTRGFRFYENSATNTTLFEWNDVNKNLSVKSNFLFHGQGLKSSALNEAACGAILLVVSLLVLVICLVLLVKTLQSLMKGPLAKVLRKIVNSDLPGKLAFLTGYIALLVGAGMTIMVQSSSVFTSTMTPLVGMGLIQIERLYPLTLGSNIGTTGTGILAALTASSHFRESIQIALCHLFFNLSGILLFYPVPFMRKIPIGIARGLGNVTADYRWFAVFYLILMFVILPGVVFGLSVAGWQVLLGVGLPILLLFITIVVINICQRKCARCLPSKLQNWNFLPEPLRSLEPYDRMVQHVGTKVAGCCKCCTCCKPTEKDDITNTLEMKTDIPDGQVKTGVKGQENNSFAST